MFVRSFVLTIILVSSLLAGGAQKKVLFTCKNGETKEFLKLLDQITYLQTHYEGTKTPYDIVLIAQSDCTKFMLSDLDDTKWMNEESPFETELKLDKLKSKVKFEQCQSSLDRMGIPNKKLRSYVKPIPSATLGNVEYQLNGYAMMPQ